MKTYITFVAFVMFCATFARTQSIPPGYKEVPMRNFAVCFLFAAEPPELFFKDPKGDFAQLSIDTSRLSTWNAVPVGERLEIFKRIVTPMTRVVDPVTKAIKTTPSSTRYELVQTWDMPPGDESVRKLYYYESDGKISHRFLDSSSESHKALQVQLINLLDTRIVFKVGQQTQTVPGGKSNVLTAASAVNEIFNFQFAYEDQNKEPYISPVKNLRFYRPTERLNILVGYIPSTEFENGVNKVRGYAPQDICFYEQTDLVPPKPKPVLVALRNR